MLTITKKKILMSIFYTEPGAEKTTKQNNFLSVIFDFYVNLSQLLMFRHNKNFTPPSKF
jgi:hypothetical protein